MDLGYSQRKEDAYGGHLFKVSLPEGQSYLPLFSQEGKATLNWERVELAGTLLE